MVFSDSKKVLLPFTELPVRYRLQSTSRTMMQDEFEFSESLLLKAVTAYNEKKSEDFVTFMAENPASDWAQTDLFIELERYYRQYIPFLNERKERCLWLNFFCRPLGDWKSQRVQINGGGICFFSVGFNLDTGKRFDFIVNEKK